MERLVLFFRFPVEGFLEYHCVQSVCLLCFLTHNLEFFTKEPRSLLSGAQLGRPPSKFGPQVGDKFKSKALCSFPFCNLLSLRMPGPIFQEDMLWTSAPQALKNFLADCLNHLSSISRQVWRSESLNQAGELSSKHSSGRSCCTLQSSFWSAVVKCSCLW